MGREGNSSSRGKAGSGASAVRKPSAAVYRRRRLFLGGVLLAVAAMVAGGMAAGGVFDGREQVSSAGQAAPSATASSSPAGTPSPTSTPSCDQKLVTVTAATDKAAYGPDEKPLLTLKVTNGGKIPCKVNIGTSQMEFLVTSGEDRIFSSRDCQARSEDLIKEIAPGASETANFPWSRNRTVEGCRAIDAKPGAGGAYYVFTAKLGAKTSPKAVFQLH
ncbi:hypothetical protein ACIQCN_07415 [Pseudarthrobacter sp. NPDC092424]|uniref:hypothetical protein n=1 Tax=Pseudarthrobacter sp. NPDC092424 TaxID=3364415 RepID=UPI00380919ED